MQAESGNLPRPKKHIRFSGLPTSTADDADGGRRGGGGGGGGGKRRARFGDKARKKKRFVRILKSFDIWEWLALGFLSLATLLFFIAFLTNGWGTVEVEMKEASRRGYNASEGEFWEFGLWQCCRNDHFCLGTRFPPFYIATRTFATFALIGQLISLTWYIGHSLEKILLYDVCAYSCLISFIWFTGLSLLLTLSCFGGRWPYEFANEFHGTRVYLDYAFYMTVVSCPLTFAAGAMILVHMIKTRDYFLSLKEDRYLTAEELLGKDEEGNVRYI